MTVNLHDQKCLGPYTLYQLFGIGLIDFFCSHRSLIFMNILDVLEKNVHSLTNMGFSHKIKLVN